MVDKSVLVKRIERIEEHLRTVAPYRSLSYEEFTADKKAQDIVEYNFFQTVNHLIDIVEHIAVDEGYGYPGTAYEAVQMVHQKGVLSDEDLRSFKRMIGFRNVVGHDYIALDKKVVFDILVSGEEDIRRIVARITEKFL